ncbi:hypothetical protein [Teichococcus aestuarii]|uniref:hypothetical protein n=1 Tax=Teichococcus aestuarii TaxID=568898 RepID=UPI0036124F36
MIVEIQEEDVISRCIVYDNAFENDVHVDSFLWRFGPAKEDGASHESAVLRRLAPEDSDVHHIGCGIAVKKNERKNNPPPGKKRKYYCGFRSSCFGSLPKSGDGYLIDIKHLPEDGVYAHVDVALTITVEGKSARANRRTEAGLALAEQFGPPVPHRCECDLEDEHHPLQVWGVKCLATDGEVLWPALTS